jgi:hypothetical protein
MNWRTHISARDEDYEYIISHSIKHTGTYQLQVRDGQSNMLLKSANSFKTIEEAKAIAEEYHQAHEKVKA